MTSDEAAEAFGVTDWTICPPPGTCQLVEIEIDENRGAWRTFECTVCGAQQTTWDLGVFE